MQLQFANWLLVIGIVCIVLAVLLKLGLLSWFGNLPGDLHVKREGFQFYLPLTTMIIVSIVLSALLSLLRKFW